MFSKVSNFTTFTLFLEIAMLKKTPELLHHRLKIHATEISFVQILKIDVEGGMDFMDCFTLVV